MVNKGFTPIIILFVVVILGSLGYIAYRKGYFNSFIPKPVPTIIPQPLLNPTQSPTSIQLERTPIKSDKQIVILNVPKYLDGGDEKEQYEVTFPKVCEECTYSITSGWEDLIIDGDLFHFFISIPKEGESNTFNSIPEKEIIRTKQFGDIFKFVYQKDIDKAYTVNYSTDYSEDCSQWQPKPAACSLMQIEFSNTKSDLNGKSYLYTECKTNVNEGIKLCDEIIKSLEIKQLN